MTADMKQSKRDKRSMRFVDFKSLRQRLDAIERVGAQVKRDSEEIEARMPTQVENCKIWRLKNRWISWSRCRFVTSRSFRVFAKSRHACFWTAGPQLSDNWTKRVQIYSSQCPRTNYYHFQLHSIWTIAPGLLSLNLHLHALF